MKDQPKRIQEAMPLINRVTNNPLERAALLQDIRRNLVFLANVPNEILEQLIAAEESEANNKRRAEKIEAQRATIDAGHEEKFEALVKLDKALRADCLGSVKAALELRAAIRAKLEEKGVNLKIG